MGSVTWLGGEDAENDWKTSEKQKRGFLSCLLGLLTVTGNHEVSICTQKHERRQNDIVD